MVWERIASTYVEHTFAWPKSNKKGAFNQIFGAIAFGQDPDSLKKGIRERILSIMPIEGRERKRYPEIDQLLDDGASQPQSDFAEQSKLEPIYQLRLNELRADIEARGQTRIDITEIAHAGARGLLSEAGAIIGQDKNTGSNSIFYGRETLALFAKRKEPEVKFPRPIVIVAYQNDKEDLEHLFAAVQVLKGACCYGAGT
jgi:hypothetical protein